MREFKLLPNDERIQSLTEEQLDLVLWSMILDNSEKNKRAEVFEDPDFDKEWDSMKPDDSSKDVWEEVE